jgi:NAD+ synthase
MPGPVDFRGVRIGIPVCEDIWGDLGVCETLAESGAEILLVPNGSPYYRGKIDIRHQVVIKQVIESDLPVLYANQFGGQDELVFDGASFAFNADRKLAFQMSQFEDQVSVTTWRRGGGLVLRRRADVAHSGAEEADYRACMLGCATTSTRTASRTSCSGCRAASIRPSARRSPSMRSARSGCAPSCCPTPTRRGVR